MSLSGHEVIDLGAGVSSQSNRGRRGPDRQERGQRILDAAAELILRWGYDKTTIDDIARSAGVAKGTIYLHWKNREALFVAVLRRERVQLMTEVRRAVVEGAEGPTLRAVLTQTSRCYLRRPLLKAVLTRDMDVIGKLARTKQADEAGRRIRNGFVGYLEALREHGLVRTDLTLAEQVNLVNATFLGFFAGAPVMPAEFALSDEATANLLAESLCRALDSGQPSTSDDDARLGEVTMRFLDEALDSAQTKYQSVLGSGASDEENAR